MKELEQSGFTDQFTYKEAKLSDAEMEMLQKKFKVIIHRLKYLQNKLKS